MGRRRQIVYALLFLYIGISLTYQVAASVFLITRTGDFNPRNQVQAPIQFSLEPGRVSDESTAAKRAGIAVGDRLESINGIRYTGYAQWQQVCWQAHVGEVVQVGMRHSNGSYYTASVPFESYPKRVSIGEQIFFVFLQIIIPLICLGLGYWVALARPMDPNAWFILILLSYPEIYLQATTFAWQPGFWLALRLYWHLILDVLTAAPLLWLGLFFPERSRIDIKWPWLKWGILGVLGIGLSVALVNEYAMWYDLELVANPMGINTINNSVVRWTILLCLVLYWAAIFDKLRTASSADSRRRLRVLCVGSAVGLGGLFVVFVGLIWFGITDPRSIKWLVFVGALFMLTFTFSLVYVVIVQRAMDVRVLLRMGTKYALARTTLVMVERGVAALVIAYFFLPALHTDSHGSLNAIIPVLAIGAFITLLIARRRTTHRLQNWLDRRFFREAYNAEVILSELAERVRTITDVSTLVETVSRRVSEVLHVPRVAVLLRTGEAFRLEHAVGLAVSGPVLLPANSFTFPQSTNGNSPAVVYSRQGRPLLAGEDGRRLLDTVQAEAILLLPGRTKLMGLMTLGPKLSEEAYSPSDLRLLGSIAVQTGLGLEVGDLARSLSEEVGQRERMQREIEIASEVQQRLFPQCIPAVPGIDLAGGCRPALGVGGDYYDMFKTGEDCLALALGDVSGKGISAALLMASLRASLRSIADEGCDHLARIVTRLNRQVHEASAASRYATFFFAVYQPRLGELRYVNAGHNPPFVLRDGCEAIPLEAGGMVVGLLKETTYTEGVVQLQAGDLLLTYTDGISEAMTEQDEEWGEKRMLAAAVGARGLPAKQILQNIMESADQFTGGAPQHDDMTLMVLKVESVGSDLPAGLRPQH